MDWMDLHSSSIWNNVTGFGGDGDPAGPIVVGEGRCVTDGPFSNLRPVRYNHTSLEHCLARGFRNEDAAGRPLNTWFGPESIGRLLRTPRYRDFEWDMENRLHNRMHRAVSGDFLSLTAANGKACQPPETLSSIVLGLCSQHGLDRPHVLPSSCTDRPSLVAVATGE